MSAYQNIIIIIILFTFLLPQIWPPPTPEGNMKSSQYVDNELKDNNGVHICRLASILSCFTYKIQTKWCKRGKQSNGKMSFCHVNA